MTTRTAMLLFGTAAAAGAAAIGAGTAALLGGDADSRVNARVDKAYQAMAGAFFTMPPRDADPPAIQRPRLVVLQGEGR